MTGANTSVQHTFASQSTLFHVAWTGLTFPDPKSPFGTYVFRLYLAIGFHTFD
jgi:hypothetical protein